MKKINKKKKGFTLIELVIVLAVLAIIALIAIPNFTKVRNDSLQKADLRAAEQIEKITLMAIANEDIKAPTTINFNFTGKNFTSVDTLSGTAKTNYEAMLKEVKAPQVLAGGSYKVIVNSDLSVDVAYKTPIDVDGDGTVDATLTK